MLIRNAGESIQEWLAILQTEKPNMIENPTEQLFYSLKQAIIVGQLTPGSKLNETQLAEQYQVSRSVLRDAYARLITTGLIEKTPNVGASVISTSPVHLTELFQLREALEGYAARLMAQRVATGNLDKPQLTPLFDTLDSYQSSLTTIQPDSALRQSKAELDFHYQLIRLCGNTQLLRVLTDELYPQIQFYRVQFGLTGEPAKPAWLDHQQIAQAISEGDGELAETLMRAHIKRSKRLIADKLQAQIHKEVTSS